MSFEQLELYFILKNYDQTMSELKKFRPTFIDERYPTIVHDIVFQIDDAERLYEEGNYQVLDLIINNLLGKETGKYRIGNKKFVISLKDAIAERKPTMNVSEWLKGYHTHGILDEGKARDSFKKETGEEPPWDSDWCAVYSTAEMQQMLAGTSGTLNHTSPETRHIAVLSIAEACAAEYVSHSWHPNIGGMGFRVDACIEAIAKAGH